MQPTRAPRSRLEDGLSWLAVLMPVVLISTQLWPEPPIHAPAPAPRALRQGPPAPPPRIYIDPDGYRVVHLSLGRGALVPCIDQDCAESGWDGAGLGALLEGIKDAEPGQDNVELVPHPDVAYSVLEETMHIARLGGMGTDARVLFPAMVVLGDPD